MLFRFTSLFGRIRQTESVERGARKLRRMFGLHMSPTELCGFVHKNSWHHYWEHGIRKSPLRVKAFKLWGASEDYRKLLDEITRGELSTEPEAIWMQLLEGYSSRKKLRYLECGHRAIAVSVMAAKFKIPCRHVTLYSVWHKTILLTHHVIELEGSRGWEIHDPDFGFCVPDEQGRPMSLRQIVEKRGCSTFLEYGGGITQSYYLKRLFALGYFSVASINAENEDTIYLTDSDVSRKVFKVGDSDIPFLEYWRTILTDETRPKIVINV
jgi:hypothetical protein